MSGTASRGEARISCLGGGLEPRTWWARGREPITRVWDRNLVRRSGASPPEAKSSSAFKSPVAEQNVPDSAYAAVDTGVIQKAFCNKMSVLWDTVRHMSRTASVLPLRIISTDLSGWIAHVRLYEGAKNRDVLFPYGLWRPWSSSSSSFFKYFDLIVSLGQHPADMHKRRVLLPVTQCYLNYRVI